MRLRTIALIQEEKSQGQCQRSEEGISKENNQLGVTWDLSVGWPLCIKETELVLSDEYPEYQFIGQNEMLVDKITQNKS